MLIHSQLGNLQGFLQDLGVTFQVVIYSPCSCRIQEGDVTCCLSFTPSISDLLRDSVQLGSSDGCEHSTLLNWLVPACR